MWIFDSSCGKRPRTRGNGPEVREFKSKTVAPEPYMFVTSPPTLDPLTKTKTNYQITILIVT